MIRGKQIVDFYLRFDYNEGMKNSKNDGVRIFRIKE